MAIDTSLQTEVADIPRQHPVLPLKNTVVFPGAMAPLAIGEERSIRLINDVVDSSTRMIALVTSKDGDTTEPGPDLLYDVGTAAVIQRMMKAPDGTLRILAQGVERIRIDHYTTTTPYLVATVEAMPQEPASSREIEALSRNIQSIFSRIIDLVPYLPDELELAVSNVQDPTLLTYIVAASMRFTTEEKQELLSERDLEARLRRITILLNREAEVLELGAKIQNEVQSDMEKEQREYYLRQQLRAIQQELGETDETQAEVNELRARIAEIDPPEIVRKAADRELDRLCQFLLHRRAQRIENCLPLDTLRRHGRRDRACREQSGHRQRNISLPTADPGRHCVLRRFVRRRRRRWGDLRQVPVCAQ